MAKTATSSAGKMEKFNMSKHIRFVPAFQDTEVDKYFLHFEKIASSLEWPKEEVWTLLLQSVLLGKAREVYSALSMDQSSDYDVVKGAILKAYKLYYVRVESAVVIGTRKHFEVTNLYKLFLL